MNESCEDEMRDKTIAYVIPTYNEVRNISSLIKKLPFKSKKIIVDDDSPDGTGEVIRALSKTQNVQVYIRKTKKGIGSAIQDGMEIALKAKDCKRIVTMDADFSHSPDDLKTLLLPVHADLVQGSRYVPNGKIIGWSFTRRFISKTANFLCNFFLNTNMKDNTSFYRVYSRRLAEIIIKESNVTGFEFALETILLARKNQMDIVEVPITFTERKYGDSKLKFRHIYRWWVYILKRCLK